MINNRKTPEEKSNFLHVYITWIVVKSSKHMKDISQNIQQGVRIFVSWRRNWSWKWIIWTCEAVVENHDSTLLAREWRIQELDYR